MYTWKDMPERIIMLLVLLLLSAAAGCYDSRGTDFDGTQEDAVTDDAGAADAAHDTAADERDDDDTDVPAPYTLHEWGVISFDETGASVWGPSPDYAGPMDEKPVIYLYSDDVIRSIDIAIDRASGTTRETWPILPLDEKIEWKYLRLEPGPCETTPFPDMWDFEGPYCEACNLGTCVVEEATCIDYYYGDGETGVTTKLLFYSGTLPDYSPPLEASVVYPVCEDDPCPAVAEFTVENNSTYDIKNAWLIYRRGEWSCTDTWDTCPPSSATIGFDFIEEIPSGDELGRDLAIEHFSVPVDEYGYPTEELDLPEDWQNLDKDLIEKLVQAGLTENEAGAFGRNWVTIFFGIMGSDPYMTEPMYSSGAFIIYFMDRDEYDEILTLTANPPPTSMERVGIIYHKLSD